VRSMSRWRQRTPLRWAIRLNRSLSESTLAFKHPRISECEKKRGCCSLMDGNTALAELELQWRETRKQTSGSP